MNETISMTDILLAVSAGYNLWFLFLLPYERIMEARSVRPFKGIAGPRRSSGRNGPKNVVVHEKVPTAKVDIIGRNCLKVTSTQTITAISAQKVTASEKGVELSEEEATFDDGNTETASRPVQVPEEKLDETFTSTPLEELEYGDDEPGGDALDTPRASGSSFDEIDDVCKATKNPDATQAEHEKAVKALTDMGGTELYGKMMEGSSKTGIRIKGLIEIQLKKLEKEFVVSDSIEDFDVHNYV